MITCIIIECLYALICINTYIIMFNLHVITDFFGFGYLTSTEEKMSNQRLKCYAIEMDSFF